MTWSEQIEIHLHDLYLNNSSHAVDAFNPAFRTFFSEEHQTFRLKMFHNLDQLRLQLERKNLHEVNAKTCLEQQDFKEYTLCEPETYRRDLLKNLDILEMVIRRVVITYGILRMKENKVNALKENERQHDTSSSSGNYITHVMDAYIRPVNDQVPFAEVDSNTTPDSTNMRHRGGHIDQDAEQYQVKAPLLNAEFFKTKDMDSPEFCKFFEINKLKAQLQAKNSTINNLKKQIKNMHEKSNEAMVKHDIDVLNTINIELEHSVAKLLAENEKLHKENEHLKQTYKDLYDSIKKTRVQKKDHNDSLIAQINSKTVENVELKAQIQEKVFANVALKFFKKDKRK
ncbi:hypothetical protein Tco_1003584 [Tanacetum coccineum]|uniref:Uncharacterized protein n=1 Tax=Tanacetum coccineum TaxID=301880 RepID=A0ABQ5F9E3_9ASTR